MAEKKVSYQVDGRLFEGMIVFDEAVTGKRPVVFMQPDWKGVCADTIGQACAVAGKDYVVLMADMFGSGYGAKPKTVDELRAGMLAVHNNLPFTLASAAKPTTPCRAKRKNSASPMPGRFWRSAIAPAVAMRWSRRAPARIL